MEFFNLEQEMFGMLLEALPNVAGRASVAKVCEHDEEEMVKKPIGHRRPTNKGERRKAEMRKRFNKACKANKHGGAHVDAHERAIVYTDHTQGIEVMLRGRELAVSAHDATNYHDPTSNLRKKEADEARLNEVINFVDVEPRRGLGVSPSLVEDRYWASYARLEKAKEAFDNAYKSWKDAWQALQNTKTEEVTMTLEEAVHKYESIVLEKQQADNELYNTSLEREEALLSYQAAFDDYEKVVREK